jgi:hypothetical protein
MTCVQHVAQGVWRLSQNLQRVLPETLDAQLVRNAIYQSDCRTKHEPSIVSWHVWYASLMLASRQVQQACTRCFFDWQASAIESGCSREDMDSSVCVLQNGVLRAVILLDPSVVALLLLFCPWILSAAFHHLGQLPKNTDHNRWTDHIESPCVCVHLLTSTFLFCTLQWHPLRCRC